MSELRHWNNFYKSWAINGPSQFAALVVSEYLRPGDAVWDLGCGNGRDTIFFHKYGFKVFASDRSTVAIENVRKMFRGIDDAPELQLVDYGDIQALRIYLTPDEISSKRLFYARFLLHSMDPRGLGTFINEIIRSARVGDRIALEFRTVKDDLLSGKTTPDHYRKGVDTLDLIRFISSAPVKILHSIEGFGLAVYKSDDAHVARLVLEIENLESGYSTNPPARIR